MVLTKKKNVSRTNSNSKSKSRKTKSNFRSKAKRFNKTMKMRGGSKFNLAGMPGPDFGKASMAEMPDFGAAKKDTNKAKQA